MGKVKPRTTHPQLHKNSPAAMEAAQLAIPSGRNCKEITPRPAQPNPSCTRKEQPRPAQPKPQLHKKSTASPLHNPNPAAHE